MIEIDCALQQYAWGKKGSNALTALLKRSSSTSFEINEEESYAELWMGTHPSGPSKIKKTNQLLSDFLQSNPSLIGSVPSDYSIDDLPFLFKVLSVHTALSIQTHPNKELARELHEKFPNIYKDSNHKPEMVIALTSFEALCGFRTLDDIKEKIIQYPELKELLDNETMVTNHLYEEDHEKKLSEEIILKILFSKVMNSSNEIIQLQINKLMTRLSSTAVTTTADEDLNKLLLRLYEQYNYDVGIFCPLLMNYVQMKSGESFFIGANELHAYLSGECIECMALSDNVVRAGLTPKLRDCSTLLSMLNYISRMPNFVLPIQRDEITSIYRPNSLICAEFEVEISNISLSYGNYNLPILSCGSIAIMIHGAAMASLSSASSVRASETMSAIDEIQSHIEMNYGVVIFIAAGIEVSITCKSNEENCIIYRAHVNTDAI